MNTSLDYRFLNNGFYRFEGIGGIPQTNKGWKSKIHETFGLEQIIESSSHLNQYLLADLLKLQKLTEQEYKKLGKLLPSNKYSSIEHWCRDNFEEYIIWAKNLNAFSKAIYKELDTKENSRNEILREEKLAELKEKYNLTEEDVAQKQRQCRTGKPLNPEKVSKELKKKYPSQFKELKLYHRIAQVKGALKRVNKEISSRCGGNPEQILESQVTKTFEKTLKQKAQNYLLQYHINLEVVIAKTNEGTYAIVTNVPDHAKPLLSLIFSGKLPFDYNTEHISLNRSEQEIYLHTPINHKNYFFNRMPEIDPRCAMNIEYKGMFNDSLSYPISASGGVDEYGSGPSPLPNYTLKEMKSKLNAAANKHPDNLTIKYVQKKVKD